MTSDDAIRFLAHEAQRCKDRDSREALALLFPVIANSLHLAPMHYADALEFHVELKHALQERAAVMTGADFPNV